MASKDSKRGATAEASSPTRKSMLGSFKAYTATSRGRCGSSARYTRHEPPMGCTRKSGGCVGVGVAGRRSGVRIFGAVETPGVQSDEKQ